jgi:hypothetical protein
VLAVGPSSVFRGGGRAGFDEVGEVPACVNRACFDRIPMEDWFRGDRDRIWGSGGGGGDGERLLGNLMSWFALIFCLQMG